MAQKDYYQIIGLPTDASLDEIKKNWWLLCKLIHPNTFDLNRQKANPELYSLSEKLFKDLQEAYEVLSDPDKRSAYDQERDSSQFGTAEYEQIENELETEKRRADRLDAKLYGQEQQLRSVESQLQQERAKRVDAEKLLQNELRKRSSPDPQAANLQQQLRLIQSNLEDERKRALELQSRNAKLLGEIGQLQSDSANQRDLRESAEEEVANLRKQSRSGKRASSFWFLASFALAACLALSIFGRGNGEQQRNPSSGPGEVAKKSTANIPPQDATRPADVSSADTSTRTVVDFSPPLSATIVGIRDDKSTFTVALAFGITSAVVTSQTVELSFTTSRIGQNPHPWPPDGRKNPYLQQGNKRYKLLDSRGPLAGKLSLEPGETYTGTLIFERPTEGGFELVHPHIKLQRPISMTFP